MKHEANMKWEDIKGTEYGQSDVLETEIGGIYGPFRYTGSQEISTELGVAISHTGLDNSDKTVRLPISASFHRAVLEASLNRGDEFYIRRDDDAQKKSGKGRGQTMQIYSLKVTGRAAA